MSGRPTISVVNWELMVGQDETPEALILRGGYGPLSPDLKFELLRPRSPEPVGERLIKLVCFHSMLTTPRALQRIDAEGYRPDHAMMLLRFGVQCPDEQRKYPVGALDPIMPGKYDGDQYALQLTSGPGFGRMLGLFSVDEADQIFLWKEDTRFIVLDK